MSEKIESQETREIGKFPVNQSTLGGLIVREAFNDNNNRANITLCVTDNDKSPKYINVLISGKERYENFKNNFEAAIKELGKTPEDKQVKPCMFVTGQAFFASNKTDKATHQNFTLIASGDLKENSDTFVLTGNKEELSAFRKTYNQNNPEINSINIRANIASTEIKPLKGKHGEFYKLSIAHNYIKHDETQGVMFANVIVPTAQVTQLKQANVEKGTPILFNGAINPTSYTNKEQNKVYSFNLVTKSLQRDHSKSTSIKKASEGIDKVAQSTRKNERLEEAQKQKDELKM